MNDTPRNIPAKIDLSTLAKRATAAAADPIADPVAPDSQAMAAIVEETPTPVEPIKLEYQQYHSSRTSTRMITKSGGEIKFTGFLFITKDEAIIAYLDDEIKKGLRDIRKGEKVATANRDPMAAVRAKHFAEFKEAQAKEAADKAMGISRTLGDNRASGHMGLNASSTSNVVA